MSVRKTSVLPRILLFAVAILVIALPTYAYVDPSAGSMIVQIVLGGVAGGLVLVKFYWDRLASIFRRKTRD